MIEIQRTTGDVLAVLGPSFFFASASFSSRCCCSSSCSFSRRANEEFPDNSTAFSASVEVEVEALRLRSLVKRIGFLDAGRSFCCRLFELLRGTKRRTFISSDSFSCLSSTDTCTMLAEARTFGADTKRRDERAIRFIAKEFIVILLLFFFCFETCVFMHGRRRNSFISCMHHAWPGRRVVEMPGRYFVIQSWRKIDDDDVAAHIPANKTQASKHQSIVETDRQYR
jgi:hypothetical protein